MILRSSCLLEILENLNLNPDSRNDPTIRQPTCRVSLSVMSDELT